MPLQPSYDAETEARPRHRGALILVLCLVALLVIGSGLAGYVWLTPQPLRFGRYALVGPGYVPPPPLGNPAFIVFELDAEVARSAASSGPALLISTNGPSGRYDVGEVLWQWGPLRWLRVLKTR